MPPRRRAPARRNQEPGYDEITELRYRNVSHLYWIDADRATTSAEGRTRAPGWTLVAFIGGRADLGIGTFGRTSSGHWTPVGKLDVVRGELAPSGHVMFSDAARRRIGLAGTIVAEQMAARLVALGGYR